MWYILSGNILNLSKLKKGHDICDIQGLRRRA